jgi:nucleoid-associated protein EbfC
MIGLPGNMQEMFKQAQKLQQEMQKVQEEAEGKEVEASAGGGMVTVKASGAGLVTSIKIDKTVVDKDDIVMLEDLVRAATNQALRKSKELMREEMKKLTGGIPIPGLG